MNVAAQTSTRRRNQRPPEMLISCRVREMHGATGLVTGLDAIGIVADQYLDPPGSAVDMAAAHKVMYQAGRGLPHISIHRTWTGSFHHHQWTADVWWWRQVMVGPSPVEIDGEALGVGVRS